MEQFAKPAVSAIIEKEEAGETFILVQRRQKEDGGETNGLLEIVGGKIREYECIFDALRREVREETGLTLTHIHGEESCCEVTSGGTRVISAQPFCVTQNLSGIYSLLMLTFLCHAMGDLCSTTNETEDVHWERADVLRDIVELHPNLIFPKDLLPLRKYFDMRNQNKKKEE